MTRGNMDQNEISIIAHSLPAKCPPEVLTVTR